MSKLCNMRVIKRDRTTQAFDEAKIQSALEKAFDAAFRGEDDHPRHINDIVCDVCKIIECSNRTDDTIYIEDIQNIIEDYLMSNSAYHKVAKQYIIYREHKTRLRSQVQSKKDFIERYKRSDNTANATIDDNSNVSNKNIGILNNEIHKEDNIEVSRGMIVDKLHTLFPEFDSKSYIRDLENHICYKHDESSFCGPIAPYCVSITMYPFLLNGLKDIGGLSAKPKNLDSFCGMFPNLIFLIAAQFAGAVATPEFLLYFDYFARKEWGDDYYKHADDPSRSSVCSTKKTIQGQIRQYFQGVVYSINQPAGSRGLQSAFVNFSYFDKPFFEGMFGDFFFPDGTRPLWESLEWLQREFMMWFNEERTRCMLTFPVESFALVYKDGEFEDPQSANFVAEEYARGHSFFTYISDTVDSLSSCCRLRNSVQTKEFSFTNGNIGVQTGSKSVITLNLNRIIQDAVREHTNRPTVDRNTLISLHRSESLKQAIRTHIMSVLERVYKYHIAYNECLWDVLDAGLLPIYSAGFINLNKQYLTIGLNGLNQAAEFLGVECRDNPEYQEFCQLIFSTIKEQNQLHNGKFNNHTITFNTEQVPAESLAIKNYNWDKKDGYWVPSDTNLYASYVFKPNDTDCSVLEKIRLHGRNYIGDFLDGGAAAHLNLDEHPSVAQYEYLLRYAAERGCNYLTTNIPNSECADCGYITKHPISTCPHCGSTHIDQYDRVIGYLTKIRNWSVGRQVEQKTRVRSHL